jgi:hypothetical protein
MLWMRGGDGQSIIEGGPAQQHLLMDSIILFSTSFHFTLISFNCHTPVLYSHIIADAIYIFRHCHVALNSRESCIGNACIGRGYSYYDT